ncbi:dystrobrevin beta-like isoform X1 [Macrosteles quadrilineatus]|uniref:dystrobrevin beta-like isoform X1 n=1 Tax=Macrosteles quadrilineatus TaxID=74068 RepID=UPI0023E1C478|nr:dystrobrevin beta-like isoform X1 [Macrosteles quadrilineatus]
MGDESGSSTRAAEQRLQLLQEMRCQNFDMIRFASYRTACKLRFIQKKFHLHSVDIWNVIEAFRENGLNTLEPQTEVNVSRLEMLISSLYHNLNKRLPLAQQVHVESLTSLLLNWLLSAYAIETLGRIRVFSIKVALATMCAGKLMDKLRYIFSQICDGNGHMVAWKFSEYLREVLCLPAAVYESPSFSFNDNLATDIFSGNGKVTVNDFMDTMMSDPGPHCLVWFPLLHRLTSVESVVHPTVCDACQRENFAGFRYRCQKCHSFQMCQDCFWRGRVSSSHTIEHEVKEYTSYKSPSKQIGHSLRKSFRCVPEKGKASHPRFPDEPEKTINLSHIVPPSPLPSHNGFPDAYGTSPYDVGSLDSRSTARSPGKYTGSLDSSRMDDEHKLIARYAARLAAESRNSQGRTASEASLGLDTSRAQRELITQLEAKNREIMREIARLRRQQELEVGLEENPALMSELRALRQRKDELETHLTSLQDSRRHLMVQLEGLMKLLKNHQASPRSTPNSSPRSTKSPPPSSRSAPPTPGSVMSGAEPPSLTNDVRSAFGGSASLLGSSNNCLAGGGGSDGGNRSLRSDLLVAADSVTCAMSTLVRELNSEGSDQEDNQDQGNIRKPLELDGQVVEDRWGAELCSRYDQEAQFLTNRSEFDNMNDYGNDSNHLQQNQGRMRDGEENGELDEMLQMNGRRR